MIGKTLSHYRILEKIGAGGMGEVYRAHDQQLDRDVALKLLPASSFRDSTARARLLQEARAAAALNHPHICTMQEYVPAYALAEIHAGLGEKDLAFQWLEKAHEERSPYMVLLKVEPTFDGLRANPRFQNLLRRMNFAE